MIRWVPRYPSSVEVSRSSREDVHVGDTLQGMVESEEIDAMAERIQRASDDLRRATNGDGTPNKRLVTEVADTLRAIGSELTSLFDRE